MPQPNPLSQKTLLFQPCLFIFWQLQTALANCQQTTAPQIFFTLSFLVSDITVFVLKRDVKLQPINQSLPSSAPDISVADSFAIFFTNKKSKLRLSLQAILPRHLHTYLLLLQHLLFSLHFHPCLWIRNPWNSFKLPKQAIWFRRRHLASERMCICHCPHDH